MTTSWILSTRHDILISFCTSFRRRLWSQSPKLRPRTTKNLLRRNIITRIIRKTKKRNTRVINTAKRVVAIKVHTMTKRKKIIVMVQPIMTHPEVAAMVTVILIWLFQLISIPIINLNLAILIHQPGKQSMY